MNMFKLTILPLVLLAVWSCTSQPTDKQETEQRAKFEPADGEVILFAGQELEAVGGLDNYSDGYYDHLPTPGGYTAYTDFLTGHESFGFMHKGLDGLTTTDDWGDGPENMSLALSDSDFDNSCLAIGLDMSQGNDSVTAIGGHDQLIHRLGNWLKELDDRPVFLRIGYEFDGYEWNFYKAEHFIPAYRRVKNKLDSMGVTNVAYTWQSKGKGANRETFDKFYPGDEYVDWVAYSFFTPDDVNHPMIQFARDHKKPLFIAESTPVLLDSNGVSQHLDLTKTADAERAWKEWFTPYFKAINDNPDVIKAISYINGNWKSRPMWKNNNFFKNIDARLTENEYMKSQWLQETNQEKYLKSSDTLFEKLHNK